MTGYTVHTGSSKKFVSGWDRVFEGGQPAKKSAKKTSGKAAQKSAGKAAAKSAKKSAGKAAKKSARNAS